MNSTFMTIIHYAFHFERHGGIISSGKGPLRVVFAPGFGHVAEAACTVDLQHVSVAADRVAHGQEVWPGTTYGELGQVGERLADGRPEQEGAHHLVKGGQVLVELGVGVQTLRVHQVGLSCGDLGWTEGTQRKKV